MTIELSERQKIKVLEDFAENLGPTLQAMERNLLTAMHQLSFSLGVVVETMKAKGLITEEELKIQGEKLNEMIQKRQKELNKKIVVPGQDSKVVNILKQDSLENLGSGLEDIKSEEEKPTEEPSKEAEAVPVTVPPKEEVASPETTPSTEAGPATEEKKE
jgi:hypothetical protein